MIDKSNNIKALDDRGIPYKTRIIKPNKITISIDSTGTVIIKYNKYIPKYKVNEFVNDKIDWITSHFLKNYQPPRKYITGEKYKLLGVEYTLYVVNSDENKIFIDSNYLIVHTIKNEYNYIDKLFSKYLMDASTEVFNLALQKCFNDMSRVLTKYPALDIKRYKSRWGCCIPKENKIILNIALIHINLKLIEFVVYHELCHFVYLNHSKDFHQLLRRFLPDESALRKQLNQNNINYK